MSLELRRVGLSFNDLLVANVDGDQEAIFDPPIRHIVNEVLNQTHLGLQQLAGARATSLREELEIVASPSRRVSGHTREKT